MGSTGFGAWREVAAHTMATRWVLAGRFDGVPMLYHWRLLPHSPAALGPGALDRWVAHWDGSPAVRARLTAGEPATTGVALFMEHIPHTVDSWLAHAAAAGGRAADSAFTMVDRGLRAGSAFLESQGMRHFDAHFHNLLTDTNRVYFADFGLATSSRFDLGPDELVFFGQHARYDRCYSVTHLSQWLVSNLLRMPWADARAHLRDRTDSGHPGDGFADLPGAAAGIVARHAPVAAIMIRFFAGLHDDSKSTPFPAEELRRALRRLGQCGG